MYSTSNTSVCKVARVGSGILVVSCRYLCIHAIAHQFERISFTTTTESRCTSVVANALAITTILTGPTKVNAPTQDSTTDLPLTKRVLYH